MLLGASADLCGSAEARDPEVLWSGEKPQRWDLWKEEGIRPGLVSAQCTCAGFCSLAAGACGAAGEPPLRHVTHCKVP